MYLDFASAFANTRMMRTIRPGKSRFGTYTKQPTLPGKIKYLSPANRSSVEKTYQSGFTS